MEKKRFPRVSEDFFSSIEEERSYLYKILDFTLQLDEIEDQNMQLTPFLKELLKILKNFLHVDELAIIVKDLHLHSWTPMISYPEVDAIHNSLDFRLLLQTAELASSTQKTIVQVLDKNKGAFLAYPLIFQDRSIGSILLFNYEFGKSTENTNTRSIPTIFNATTPEYSKLLKLLWYINELENDAIVERLEISETQSLLGKYISSQVMEKIIQSPLSIDLEGQENEVTVLFADMCGFTKLSEELPSKVIVTLLNTYWSYLVDIVFKYQGTVDKFIGDCIMVVFNSPIEQKDHYVRACATALDIQKCMDQLRNQSEYKEYQLEISIGINTGSATCGNVGSKDRLEYTVIGDSVNLAARLEQLAVAGEILISESVFEKVHGGFVINRPDQVNLKGKTNLIQPYQLERFFEPKEIIERFSHSSKKEQKNMLASLSFSNELNNAENFIDLLEDCDDEIGIYILDLIEIFFSIEVVPKLSEWVQNTNKIFLISKAVKVIAFLGGAQYLKILTQFLDHDDDRIVANTIESISIAGAGGKIKDLSPFLNHSNQRVRLQACQVYWEDNPEKAIDLFLEAIQSKEQDSQKSAIFLISRINQNEVLFSFLDRYVELPDLDRTKIRELAKEFSNQTFLQYLEVTENSIERTLGNPEERKIQLKRRLFLRHTCQAEAHASGVDFSTTVLITSISLGGFRIEVPKSHKTSIPVGTRLRLALPVKKANSVILVGAQVVWSSEGQIRLKLLVLNTSNFLLQEFIDEVKE